MNRRTSCLIGLAAAASALAVASPIGPVAFAGPPIGGCTQSYSELSYDGHATPSAPDISTVNDPLLAQVAPLVDSNGDFLICFKPYPNGFHNGHGGNLVDDKSGPHT